MNLGYLDYITSVRARLHQYIVKKVVSEIRKCRQLQRDVPLNLRPLYAGADVLPGSLCSLNILNICGNFI